MRYILFQEKEPVITIGENTFNVTRVAYNPAPYLIDDLVTESLELSTDSEIITYISGYNKENKTLHTIIATRTSIFYVRDWKTEPVIISDPEINIIESGKVSKNTSEDTSVSFF